MTSEGRTRPLERKFYYHLSKFAFPNKKNGKEILIFLSYMREIKEKATKLNNFPNKGNKKGEKNNLINSELLWFTNKVKQFIYGAKGFNLRDLIKYFK